MLHHLTLWVPDLDRAAPSWRWLLCEHLEYRLDEQSRPGFQLYRHGSGFTVVLEQSDDMVPGMLHSRFRPGLNHVAFTLASTSVLAAVLDGAADNGWTQLPGDRHPLAARSEVVYLEDRDGFEVELVAPAEG
jgi:catechol 2,3-dioxygenase-like lactoylglutathione lyase family enzyme